MGIRYVLAVNVRNSTVGDKVNLDRLNVAVRNNLSQYGFTTEAPQSVKHAVGDWYVVARSNITVSLNIPGASSLDAVDTGKVDTAIMYAIRDAAGLRWDVANMLRGMPRQGDGSYQVSLWPGSDVTDIQRQVARGEGTPRVTITHPVATSRVTDSTDQRVPVGNQTPGAASQGIDSLKESLGEYKPYIIAGIAVVGLASVAAIVVKVK